MAARRNKKKSDIRRVVLYARVSTAEQAEKNLSLPAQLDALRTYCKTRGYAIAAEYVESGASATDDANRPKFGRMMGDVLAPAADVDAILVCYTSRFMRNIARARFWKDRLRKEGIRVIATFQETSDDPMGGLVEGMFELIDEYESTVNGMRTMAAMRENAKQGYFNGSQAPFGFRADKIEVAPERFKRVLVPNADEIPAHNEVVRSYVELNGAKSAARLLNQNGRRYRRGAYWTKDLVLKVIDESAAIGVYYWGKRDAKTGAPNPEEDWVAISVTPIIDRELFDMAQKLREKRDPKRNPGRTSSSPMLLAGLVQCGRPGCAASYQLETSGKSAASGLYTYRYYNCRNHLRIGKEKCDGFRIAADVLERAVLEHIAERLFTEERCTQILRDVVDETGVMRQKTAEQRRQLERDLADIEKRLRRWADAFESGDPAADLGTDRMVELKAKRGELQQTLAKVVPMKAPPPSLYSAASIQTFQTSLRTIFLANDTPVTKSYLKFLIEKIVVTGSRIRIFTRSEAVVRMMAATNGASGTTISSNPDDSPSFEVGWLAGGDKRHARQSPR